MVAPQDGGEMDVLEGRHKECAGMTLQGNRSMDETS